MAGWFAKGVSGVPEAPPRGEGRTNVTLAEKWVLLSLWTSTQLLQESPGKLQNLPMPEANPRVGRNWAGQMIAMY